METGENAFIVLPFPETYGYDKRYWLSRFKIYNNKKTFTILAKVPKKDVHVQIKLASPL